MADRTVEIAPSAEAYRSESYASAAPEGYLYASANPETFTVDGSGTPITVVFTYAKKPAVTAPVTFEYVSESGRVVENPRTVPLPVGPTDVMEYRKVVDGEEVTRVAYEVSVMNLLEEEAGTAPAWANLAGGEGTSYLLEGPGEERIL